MFPVTFSSVAVTSALTGARKPSRYGFAGLAVTVEVTSELL
jgi:hypothetical protein